MKIIIVYGTYSTGTLSVAEKAATFLIEKGNEVVITRNDVVQKDDLLQADLILLGSPSWKVNGKQGMPHEAYYPMMERLKDIQYNKPFAVYALGDESYALICGAADHLQQFVKDLGGYEVIEPLKLEGYYFAEEIRTEELYAWLTKLLEITNKKS